MKKVFPLIITIVFVNLSAFCQIQRTIPTKPKIDTTSSQMQGEKVGRRQMMKELGLSRAQMGKFKEAMQDIKSQKAALEADTTLTPAARQEKGRELRKLQAEKMNGILDEVQRAKLKKMRLDKKDMKQEETGLQ